MSDQVPPAPTPAGAVAAVAAVPGPDDVKVVAASPPPKFTQGSILGHVVVMTATASIGLIAIFIVDFLNLFYISRLGEQELAAAVGYASTLIFFQVSVSIGITIAVTALTARALGAGEKSEARRLAGSGLLYMVIAMAAMSAGMWPWLTEITRMLGATGRTLDIAVEFLRITVPSMAIMGIGMATSGILRAAGDAKRAMYVTLAGGVASAIFDPILIFGFGWGVPGAAVATVMSRIVLAVVGLHGTVLVHDLLAASSGSDLARHWKPLTGIALPAILTNVATPVANGWITAAIAPYGDAAVAGWAVINRLIPLAFGGLFALSGAVGPIFGQNLGAGQLDRVRRTVTDSLIFAVIYSLGVWVVLIVAAHPIANVFGMAGQGADLVVFFCHWVAGSFVFTGALFVANAAFNNLGFPTLSTLFNWGRATIGTIPFAWIGAYYWGASGVVAGQGIGSVVFGTAAVLTCYRVVGRVKVPARRGGA